MAYDNVVAKSEGTFEQPSTGMHQAVCVFVHDIGTHVGEYQGKQNVRHQVIVTWELAEKMKTGEYEGKPFNVSKFYTLSLGDKANLRKDLEGWRGKAFTEEELQGFDLRKLIGVNCFLNLSETENGKRKIASVNPLPNNMPKIGVTQLEPSEKFMAFIDKKRAESLEAQQQNGTSHIVVDNGSQLPPDDLLPF